MHAEVDKAYLKEKLEKSMRKKSAKTVVQSETSQISFDNAVECFIFEDLQPLSRVESPNSRQLLLSMNIFHLL